MFNDMIKFTSTNISELSRKQTKFLLATEKEVSTVYALWDLEFKHSNLKVIKTPFMVLRYLFF